MSETRLQIQQMLTPAYKALLSIEEVKEPWSETFNAYYKLCRIHEYARKVLRDEWIN